MATYTTITNEEVAVGQPLRQELFQKIKDNFDFVVSETFIPVQEAPVDGKQYARKDAGWEQVVSGAVDMLVATGKTVTAGNIVELLTPAQAGGTGGVSDISTVGSITGEGINTPLINSYSVFESASSDYFSVTVLDEAKLLVCYRDLGNANYGTACVLSISGTTVTAGTPAIFEAAGTDYISLTALTSSKAIVCYRDGDNNYGTACVLSISGTTITAGTPAVFESAVTIYTAVTMLDSSKAIVCYADAGSGNYGTACILSISGTTITAGTPAVFESAQSDYIKVSALDSTKVVACYQDSGNSGYGTACVLSISGTTITAGTPAVFNSGSTTYISTDKLDATHIIVSYRDDGNASQGTACVLTISGTAVSAGAETIFETGITAFITVKAIDATKAIVCYTDSGNSFYGTVCVLTVSSNVITAGTPSVYEAATSFYNSCTIALDKLIVCYQDQGNSSYGTACMFSIHALASGVAATVEAARTEYTSLAALNSTQLIACYRDVGNSNYGTAVILTISGTTVTAGTPTVFESANTQYISVAALDSTKAIVCYQDAANANYGTACVLSISGTTITAGTPVVFESGKSVFISVASLDSAKAIVCYQDFDNSSYGTACVLSISGTTITPGSAQVFSSAQTSYSSVAKLDSAKAIVGYKDGGNSYYGTARVLSISGSTISVGGATVFESAQSDYVNVIALTSSKAIVGYTDAGNSNYGTVCILSVSGTTITAGTPSVFVSQGISYLAVSMLDEYKLLACFRDGSTYGSVCPISVVGTTVTAANPITFASAATSQISAAALSSSKLVTFYQGPSSTYYGIASVITLTPPATVYTPVQNGTVFGYALGSGTAGQSVSVTVGPFITGLVGLTVGSIYYIGQSGITTAGTYEIGRAVSSTILKLKAFY